MIVADTSYIVEAILHDSALLDDEPIVAPDLALYETMNAIWKHETLIRDLENASMYIDAFLKLIRAGTIILVKPDDELVREAYSLSVRCKTSIYDTMFIALALQLKTELKTLDRRQSRIYEMSAHEQRA